MERVARNVSIRFRKDITRSFIDYHVRLAIEDRTIHGHVLNISGGTQTYETEVRGFEDNQMVVTDWPNSPTRNHVSVFCDAHHLPFVAGAFDSICAPKCSNTCRSPGGR